MSLHTETITYTDSQGTKLDGYVGWDKEKISQGSKLPGVLVAHTMVGPQEEFIYDKVHRLAELGYVGFALDIFGTGRLITNDERPKFKQLMAEDRGIIASRAQAALNTLQTLEHVQSDNIAAIGYCLGGKIVIDLARTNPSGLKGVIFYHGILDRHIVDAPSRFNARVLAFHGSKDPYITPEMYQGFIKEMEERNVDCDVVTFVGCVHSFTRPDKTTAKDLELSQQYNANADKRSWEQTLQFFNQVLGQ
eukprot:TRINITY_DN4123_c0_g2_i1.p1 TRINITY_DN4123_c0_g2~~TRINITY_DN4123_c0_g2_i1.p1  ORF type:complete len:285 (-),score=27.51 TRINITY_DN4123_c0_g2_i1:561-1307(-)